MFNSSLSHLYKNAFYGVMTAVYNAFFPTHNSCMDSENWRKIQHTILIINQKSSITNDMWKTNSTNKNQKNSRAQHQSFLSTFSFWIWNTKFVKSFSAQHFQKEVQISFLALFSAILYSDVLNSKLVYWKPEKTLLNLA